MEPLKERVKELLEKGEIGGFLGYRGDLPYLFTRAEELDGLAVSPHRYPLPQILAKLQGLYPEGRFGLLVRGCDERSLIELIKNNKIQSERVVPLGVACDQELAERCGCERPYPTEVLLGEKVEGREGWELLERLEAMDEEERFRFWMSQFAKCIKCYGCRNICPQCFCDTCALEEEDLIAGGTIPPEMPAFHLVRAFHMAGRCVDCGLCEEACPAGIPLRTLYKEVRRAVKDLFGYEPGLSVEEKEPFGYLGDGRYEVPERLK